MIIDRAKSSRFGIVLLVMAWVSIWQGCAQLRTLPEESQNTIYTIDGGPDPLVARWAPIFLAHGYADAYNRIGRPTVAVRGDSQELWVDPAQPTVYVMKRRFTTPKATYTNLIYRVHFPEVPYSLVPFNLTAGENVGLMVVVTLDAHDQPVLITSVHTCGCYKAFTPTDYLPVAALPGEWHLDRPNEVYGERLPPRLNYSAVAHPKLLVHLRPALHRVMDLQVVSAETLQDPRYAPLTMAMAPMADLQRLPIDGATTSFFYDTGWRQGYVKGSIKPFEMIFLSWISLDLFVGSDKTYADPQEGGNRFYTSLKPWRRDDSDMWDFARFLAYWGWRL